ncbi:MAG: tRNA (cytidine(34)-2'-O)-methyltransferase [Firmicutes bacterium]|nr:tRNA (cytidine(34)-2'-O)-methyltransferase [Bacillota bacterium]
MLEIVLVHPQIPQNAGNIGRTCVSVGARLHLVEPLGFSLADKYMKRAGLDYWQHLDWELHKSWDEFRDMFPERPLYCFSTKGTRWHTAVAYPEDAMLLFGSETTGLPPEVLAAGEVIRLPMRPDNRSLNLGNTVAVAAYEWLRQWQYPGLV